MQLTLRKWNLSIGSGQKLFCILGLNVLEDRDLALETARHLKEVTTALDLPFVFKASFDKANRSSFKSYRGPGMAEGLKILAEVKETFQVPVCTDLHEVDQAEPVAEVADLVQIPAFLCRQTDLVVATARATLKHEGLTILCERGSSFGYNNLVVDMLAIPEMQRLGAPVTMDATHAVQLPGAQKDADGVASGGRREGVAVLAAAAVAAGVDGMFLEFHPDPDKALCDGPSCLPLSGAAELLGKLKALHTTVHGYNAY